jgi:hypothetical protein
MYFECNGCLTLDLPFPEPAAYAAPLFLAAAQKGGGK